MKFFFKFLIFSILNNAGELDETPQENVSGGEGLEKYLDDANLDDLGAEEGETVENAAENDSENPSEEGQGDEPTEETPESILDSLEENSEEGNPDFLNSVNDLGFVHNGLPFEIENVEQLKELVQKGHDYTLKTQGLSEEKKAFEAEMTSQREAFEKETASFKEEMASQQNAIMNYQILSNVLGKIQSSDPELFNELDQMFTQESNSFASHQNNPRIEQLEGELNKFKDQIENQEKAKAEEEKTVLRKEWESGLEDVQKAYGTRLRKLGVKPNWEEVQKTWGADSTGKMTVKAALLAVHGEAIMKASEAQKKLLAARKTPPSEPVLDKDRKSEPKDDSEASGSYLGYLGELAKKYAG